ncbi:MAG: signal peptide peptidase SppA [Acidobacteria bacterium]|nr:signal peptide peptidase SppA [Acidobacteriota bacterium]
MPEPPSRVWLWVVIAGGAFFVFFLAIFTLVYVSVRSGEKTEYEGKGGKIGVVDIDGIIVDAEATVRDLKKFAEDDDIKAIILHLDTPGGGAAASEEIAREVRLIRGEKKKRVVASIATVGASGGYYIASAADKIFSDQASVVGSIGVIAEWVNYGELLRWARLKQVIIKAGEFKDTGDPSRDLTPAERDYLQGMIDDMHGQFIRSVAEGRKMKVEDVRQIANGKVWTGEQALALHLVDQIGGLQEALHDTAAAAGIKEEPSVVKPEREKRSLLDLLLGDASDLVPNPTRLMQQNVGFYYMWQLKAR